MSVRGRMCGSILYLKSSLSRRMYSNRSESALWTTIYIAYTCFMKRNDPIFCIGFTSGWYTSGPSTSSVGLVPLASNEMLSSKLTTATYSMTPQSILEINLTIECYKMPSTRTVSTSPARRCSILLSSEWRKRQWKRQPSKHHTCSGVWRP